MRFLTPFRSVVVLVALVACANSPHAQPQSAAAADIAELWQEPTDLLERDLLNGPGGAELAPPPNGSYEFVAFKTTGTNPGYDVQGRVGPVVERQARHRGAIGSHRVADPVGDGISATRDLLRAAIHAHRHRRRREDQRAIPHRPRRSGDRPASGRGTRIPSPTRSRSAAWSSRSWC